VPEDRTEVLDITGRILLSKLPDMAPLLRRIHVLHEPLRRQIRGPHFGSRNQTRLVKSGRGRESDSPPPARVIQSVDREKLSLALKHPVPAAANIVVDPLAQTPGLRESERPEWVESRHSTVDVTATLIQSTGLLPWVKDPDVFAQEIQDPSSRVGLSHHDESSIEVPVCMRETLTGVTLTERLRLKDWCLPEVAAALWPSRVSSTDAAGNLDVPEEVPVAVRGSS
jgi:hypothetical protein